MSARIRGLEGCFEMEDMPSCIHMRHLVLKKGRGREKRRGRGWDGDGEEPTSSTPPAAALPASWGDF